MEVSKHFHLSAIMVTNRSLICLGITCNSSWNSTTIGISVVTTFRTDGALADALGVVKMVSVVVDTSTTSSAPQLGQLVEYLVDMLGGVSSSSPRAVGAGKHVSGSGCAVSQAVGVAEGAGAGTRQSVEHLVSGGRRGFLMVVLSIAATADDVDVAGRGQCP
jgi:hypothetical protein